MRTVLAFLFIFSIVLACKNKDDKSNPTTDNTFNSTSDISLALSKSDTYVAAAIETCDCMQPMFEIMQQMDNLKQDEDSKVMQEYEAKLAQIRPQIAACSEAIQQKYGKMESPKARKKIMEALKKYCPSSFEILSRTVSTKY